METNGTLNFLFKKRKVKNTNKQIIATYLIEFLTTRFTFILQRCYIIRRFKNKIKYKNLLSYPFKPLQLISFRILYEIFLSKTLYNKHLLIGSFTFYQLLSI